MKKRKFIFTGVIALVLAFAFIACGQDKNCNNKYQATDYSVSDNDKMEWQMGWYPKEEKQHYSAWFGNVGATHGKDYLFPCFSKKSLDVNTTMKYHAVAQEW